MRCGSAAVGGQLVWTTNFERDQTIVLDAPALGIDDTSYRHRSG